MQPSPYAPPRDPYPNAPMRAPGGVPAFYASPRSAGKLALVLSGGVVGISVLLRFVDVVLFAAPPLFDLVRAISKLLGLVHGLMRLGAGISILLWVNRTAKNVRALGLPGLSMDPTMCVVWFFIPIANLVLPAIAVSQIARASQREPRSIIAPMVWWAAYVGAVIASGGAFMISVTAFGRQMTFLFILNCIVTTLYAASFAALYALVRQINGDQDERAEERRRDGAERPREHGR